jgi:cyclopropane-fatty-acyl-phospholipid synthase
MSGVRSQSKSNSKAGLSIWQKMVAGMADRIVKGSLTLKFTNGREYVVSRGEQGPKAELFLKNPRPIWRLVTSGDLGFARSYIDGDWDSPDIGALLSLALENEAALSPVTRTSVLWGKLAYLRHRLRANTRKGSRKNIAYHYDLGNEFYGLWLDETMTYSSALFHSPDLTLADAQRAKYDRIIKELNIGPEDRVLEIGCGWGGFAEYAAKTTGCHVTGLTISQEQAAYARRRLDAQGLADRTEIRIEDYRDTQGAYDKIVSIEMFEAVGEENWSRYFETIRDRLKAGGRAMIQTITIDDSRFEAYRRNADYIQTYIFPGGMLPSLSTFKDAASNAGLAVKDWLGFGTHYAKTLLTWDEDFIANWERIRAMGFDDRFKRMWRYYLHYCAAGFSAGSINVLQLKLVKP